MNSQVAQFLSKSGISTQCSGVVDFSVWFGSYPFRGIGGSGIADWRRKADDLGIELAIASPLESVFWENNLDAYARAADELAGDPRVEVWPVVRPGGMHGLEAMLDKYNPRGIRLVPSYHDYHLYDHSAEPIMALARERGLAVQVFTRIADERWHYMLKAPELPLHDLEYAASIFEDQTIIVSGLNRPQSLVSRMKQHPRLYSDISRLRAPVFGFEQLVTQAPTDRLVFGSLWPIQIIEATLWQVTSARVDPTVRNAVLSGNANALLVTPAQRTR